MLFQVVPPSVLYCQLPSAVSALAVMTMPSSEAPLSTSWKRGANRSATVLPMLLAVGTSSAMARSVVLLTNVGRSLTAVTATCTPTLLPDTAPSASRATTEKAVSVPLALAAGVHTASLPVVTKSLLPMAQAAPPMVKLPLLTCLTTKPVTVPAVLSAFRSDSLPLAISSA